MEMNSSRPYLVRALYEWILDNDCTPYILVNAMASGVEVPLEHVKDGQIILNISPAAVHNLLLQNDAIDFDGRFAGIPQRVFVPMEAVMGIYAKENGQGMIFEATVPQPEPPALSLDSEQSKGPRKSRRPAGKPSLKIVK